MTIEQFRKAAGLSSDLAERWFAEITEAMDEFGIDTPKRQAAFIAQVGTESAGFSRLSESFNYSVEGLIATFGNRIPRADAMRLGRQPGEKSVPVSRQAQIASLVYGGRYGNDRAGDGWKFRGRGLKQVTFHDNYLDCGEALGLDLINHPDLLLEDVNAARSAGWFWEANGCNAFADAGDFVGLTKRINGGTNGLEDRKARWAHAKVVLIG
jgi:putative chitinase